MGSKIILVVMCAILFSVMGVFGWSLADAQHEQQTAILLDKRITERFIKAQEKQAKALEKIAQSMNKCGGKR